MPARTLRQLYSRNVSDIAAVLGTITTTWAPERSSAPAPLLLLLEAVDGSALDRARALSVRPILEGCVTACEVTAQFFLKREEQTYSVRKVRRYHRGTILDERLELASADHRQLFGWVVYDLAGTPNCLATVTYDEGPFRPVVSTYDSALGALGQAKFDVITADDRALGAMRRSGARARSVGLCRDA